MEDILNKDGNEFKMKAHIVNALSSRGLLDDYATLQTENGGFIGVPIGDERLAKQAEQESPKAKNKKIKCRVYRANCDEANRDQMIKITANGPRGRIVFLPGEEVSLTETQIGILRDSVLTNEIEIDPASGIYSARNPETAAKNQYPNMQIRRDPMNGRIVCHRNIPNFIIEKIEAA